MSNEDKEEKLIELYKNLADFESTRLGPQSLRDLIIEGITDQIQELEEQQEPKEREE